MDPETQGQIAGLRLVLSQTLAALAVTDENPAAWLDLFAAGCRRRAAAGVTVSYPGDAGDAARTALGIEVEQVLDGAAQLLDRLQGTDGRPTD